MTKTRKTILLSVLTILLCASLVAGATFALFTSESTTNIAITSGKVDVEATVDNLTTYSQNERGEPVDKWLSGEAVQNGSLLELKNMAPYDGVTFDISIVNRSTVTVKWQLQITTGGDSTLFDALEFEVSGADLVDTGSARISNWVALSAVKKGEESQVTKLSVRIELPESASNDASGKSCTLAVTVYAVQGNAKTDDPVAKSDVDPNTVYVYNLDDLTSLGVAVNGGDSHKGKTVVIKNDVDLSTVENWTPIGISGAPFAGTFDGNGQTISNLRINQIDGKLLGLFGIINSPAIVKNVRLVNAQVKGQSSVSALIGNAYTGTVIDCAVSGLIEIEGNYQVGGISGGQAYAKIVNCSVMGASGSYIKGIHLEENLEGDAVGGIVAYSAETSDHEHITGCVVDGVDVEGTRKVGGIAGQVGSGNGVLNCTYSNGTVRCNASGDYLTERAGQLYVGGIVGEAILGVTGNGKTPIKGNSVTNVTVVVKENNVHTGTDVEIIGGSRGTWTQLEYSDNTITNSKVLWNGIIVLGARHYGVDSAETLKAIAEAIRTGVVHSAEGGGAVTITQMADIDMRNELWMPLTMPHVTYDGNGHTISNLNCGYDANGKSAFLAGYGNTVKALTLENVTASGTQASAFIANTESGLLSDCTLRGTVNISYNKSANANETHPAIGVFFAVMHGAEKVSNLTIDEDCVVTLDLDGLTSSQALPYKNLLLGFAVSDGSITEEKYAEVHVLGLVQLKNSTITD